MIWRRENPWECCASDVWKNHQSMWFWPPFNTWHQWIAPGLQLRRTPRGMSGSYGIIRVILVMHWSCTHGKDRSSPNPSPKPHQTARERRACPSHPLSPETKETALQMFFTRESKCFTQRLQILGWPSTWCKISSYQKNAGDCATKVQCNSNGIRDN